MKIINIILTSQNGGAEQAFIDYLTALKKLGHENLAILKDKAPYENKVLELGIPLRKIKNNLGFFDFFAVRKIKNIIEEYQADVLICHMGRSVSLVRNAIKQIKKRKVFQIAVNHSDNVRRSIGADIVISVNRKILAKTVDLGQNIERSFVVPNAIDLSDALFNRLEDFSKKEQITICSLGRFDRTKGFDLLIKSLAYLKENSSKKFILKLAGSGYFEPELRSLVKNFNLENEVEFLGWIKDKKDFFSAADIFCIPSQNEPFGIVVLEAMKYCKPIISTDADGPKEILSHEKDGLIVNLKPAETFEKRLAETFIRLASDANLANDLVRNASKKLQEKYSYSALENILNEIIGKV
jgi:glycosyltransferase involved in cell wall biosynthesis